MSQWKDDLKQTLDNRDEHRNQKKVRKQKNRHEILKFYANVALPALEALKAEWERHGRSVYIYADEASRYDLGVTVVVLDKGIKEFEYTVKVSRRSHLNLFRRSQEFLTISDVTVRGRMKYTLQGARRVTKEKLAKTIVARYKKTASRSHKRTLPAVANLLTTIVR